MCKVCNGTGICQHCYVPTRQNTIQNMGNVAPTQRKTGRSIAAIQADIRKTEFELDRVNKMLLQYELRQDYGLFYRNQKQYALKLEHRITDLYNEMSRSV
jgi:hypothetical protein